MWNSNHQRWLLSLSLAIGGSFASSCGSSKKSDGDELVTGVDGAVVRAADSELVIASKLALIPPKQAGSGLWLTDLENDTTNSYVEERSLEALEHAESILCFINQTRFETQVNQGPYFATVNQDLCEERRRDDQGGQSLMNMKVDVTREPNAPLHAIGWIDEEEDGETKQIQWRLVIAEGSNSLNPLGIFRFNWAFRDSDGNQMGGGLIESKRTAAGIVLDFYSSDGDQNDSDRGGGFTAGSALLNISGDGVIIGGRARTARSWEDSHYTNSSQYQVDFNDNYLAKIGSFVSGQVDNPNSGEENACIDRGQFDSVAYRYGLYKADGSRKNLNSGFPIEFEKNGRLRRGHASYWGIWAEGNVSLQNGDAVNKVDWSGGEKTLTPFTVLHSPGKLIKYSKNTISLGELRNTDLRMRYDNKNYIVQWNGSKFVKVAEEVNSNNGPSLEPASGDVETPEWGLHFWVDSLSANINIGRDQNPTNNLQLSYHSQEVVSGQVGNLTLRCFSRCPRTDGSSNVDRQDEWMINIAEDGSIAYTFNTSDKKLYRGGVAIQAPSSQHSWIDSGVLVTDAQLGSLGSENISPWELQGRLDNYYRWQSGSDPWSQYYGLKAANGSMVSFDKPLEFKYVHSQANDFDGKAGHADYGKTFRLNYGGFGDLWGIPWHQGNDDGNYKPNFSIKNGVKLTDNEGTEYTLKAINVAQILSPVSASFCADLDPTGAPPLPTEDMVVAVDLGDAPADDIPLRVIEGELLD